ncbi:hypothetical protein [Streptomyces sp. x-80]|uniref:hypothetical protein n=1 Tax=Streptomyces sp. x-80 TaxID=2789282 RepID=UPI00397FB774
MKAKVALIGAALPAVMALTAAPAHADSSKPGGPSGLLQAKEAADIGCWYRADSPYFLTGGGTKIWATAKITGCTSTPPDRCHLTVSIAGPISDVAHKDDGWKPCSKKTLKVGYNCPSLVKKSQYTTVATLAMEYKGRTNSHVFSSKEVTLWCG